VSILIDKNTRLIVQGITGRDGAFHTQQMLAYGTKVVGGVTPGKGGSEMHGVPVFDSMAEAVAATKANTSVIYVPAPFAADAIHEAADAGLSLIVCITEGLPVRDTLGAFHKVLALRDPGSPGALDPSFETSVILREHGVRELLSTDPGMRRWRFLDVRDPLRGAPWSPDAPPSRRYRTLTRRATRAARPQR